MPSNSTICPKNGPKRRQKAPKSPQCALAPRNQARAVSWARWLTFYGFQGGAGRQPSPRTVGADGGPTRVPGAKKQIFSEGVPRPLGMLKQVFLGCFEPVVACFGPRKFPKCLENGPFQDQKGVANGSKTCFSKSDPGPFGMLKQVVLAHFEPVVACFGPWKIPKSLEIGLFWDRKWVKNGSKPRFSGSRPRPFGMLTQVF